MFEFADEPSSERFTSVKIQNPQACFSFEAFSREAVSHVAWNMRRAEHATKRKSKLCVLEFANLVSSLKRRSQKPWLLIHDVKEPTNKACALKLFSCSKFA
jgi:hypothetical protein